MQVIDKTSGPKDSQIALENEEMECNGMMTQNDSLIEGLAKSQFFLVSLSISINNIY